MNKDNIKGEWNQIKGKIKEKWGKLTDDDLTVINGKRDQLAGALQKKYGYEKEKVEKDVAEFENQYNKKTSKTDEKSFNRDLEDELESSRKYELDDEDDREIRKTGTEDL